MTDHEIVKAAAAEFSGTFGLRSIPGESGYYVNVEQSFVSRGVVQLYMFDRFGRAFAKATPDELRPLVVGRLR